MLLLKEEGLLEPSSRSNISLFTPLSSMPIRTRVVALLLFWSGFCALLYQTTWLREFRLVFGASTAASAAVVGVFMAGLGLGGVFLGRRSERAPQPLRFYANLEFAIALTAAPSPILILPVPPPHL